MKYLFFDVARPLHALAHNITFACSPCGENVRGGLRTKH